MSTKRKRNHHRHVQKFRPKDLAELALYHHRNPTWGVLHIVLEDGNVEDSDVDFCIEKAIERNDRDGLKLARMLRRLSPDDRAAVGRLAEKLVRRVDAGDELERAD